MFATEAIPAELTPVNALPAAENRRRRPDLRYDGKTNQQLVRDIMALGDKIEVHTFW